MSNIGLQEICNVIILVSAVIIAVKNIYGFIKKPVKGINDYALKAEQKRMEETLRREVPQIIKDNLQDITATINELKAMNQSLQKQLEEIQQTSKMLKTSQLDLLRYDMNRLYYKYRPYKKMLDCDKKAFMKFYTDYHDAGGNTWIDTLYEEVKEWGIVHDEDELKN